MGKTIGKNLSSKYSLKLLDHTKQSVANLVKNGSKRAIEETTKLLIKSQKTPEFHHRIVHKQLQMKHKILKLIEKYLKKYIHIYIYIYIYIYM